MNVRVRVGLLFTAVFLLGTMMACGGGTSSIPSLPATPSLQSITINPSAPSIIAGGTEQYSAMGNYSDGSTQDLTSTATWRSSDTTVATVSSTGLAKTLTEGTSTISASLQSITGSASQTAGPLTVQVSVQASDSAGHPLTYRWQATDGSIQNLNAATTTWTLTDGPGLHFAYVLVSNGFGGYTERRLTVNTDTIGTPLQVPTPKPFTAPPPASTTPTAIFRGFLAGGQLLNVSSFPGAGPNWSPGIPMSVPDVAVSAIDVVTNQSYPPVNANVRGEFVIPMSPSTLFSDGFNGFCGFPTVGGPPMNLCGTAGGAMGPLASGYVTLFNPFSLGIPTNPFPDMAGEVLLQDGSTCGIVDEFFGIEVVPTATLLVGNIFGGTVRANQWGDYDLPFASPTLGPISVSLQCENNPPIVVPISNFNAAGTTQVAIAVVPASAPTVTSMTATLPDGTALANGSVIFQPPPTQVPSDIVPLGDAFLAEKGVDSRLGACQYYKAVGAVQGCDAAGNFSGAINFEDWKSQVKIDQYATNPPNTNLGGTPVYTATYINKVDLNLTRNHHSVVNGQPADPSMLGTAPYTYVANYVCNHAGPSVPNPPQTGANSIDSVIQSTVNGQNLVACVAMDYSTFPVNGQPYGPFIRFLIFGPNGRLLPSVNLDQRSEKFVPGTCVICHGGDHYAGKYPEDGTGNTDVGGHFLPYDTGNFEFSSQPSLTEADQEQVLYYLNQSITAFNNPAASDSITPAEQELITNWYGSGQVLNKNYVEQNWLAQGATAANVYQNVYARSCRTCHVALPNYNFEQNPGLFQISGLAVDPVNCGGGADRNRMYKMPNSLTTFNLFWGSHNSLTGFDQVTAFHQFLNCPTNNPSANVVPIRGRHK